MIVALEEVDGEVVPPMDIVALLEVDEEVVPPMVITVTEGVPEANPDVDGVIVADTDDDDDAVAGDDGFEEKVPVRDSASEGAS